MWPFRRRRGKVNTNEKGELNRKFSISIESADRGLCFEANFNYQWRIREDNEGRVLNPDAVARSLLADAVREKVSAHPVLHTNEAEWAANHQLSKQIITDRRLLVTGQVRLRTLPAVEEEARARIAAANHARLQEAAETARLEVLRDRLLTQGLGLVWWIDRYADSQFASGDPGEKTASVVEAFKTLTHALRQDSAQANSDAAALLRARMEELLTVLENPELASILEELIAYLSRQQDIKKD
ncbi:hypothetical protein ABZ645_12155 [Nocardiopsis alba]|uniref:hypothetical protein n=1 Tax=Nocardiopsis alba TaxID=53437 RepID=UPI00340A6814